MALLLYSDRCPHSKDVLSWLDKHQQVRQMIRFHDVTIKGLPQQYKSKITSVPTMLTQNGKILTGHEVTSWLESLIPPEKIEHIGFGSCGVYSIDGDDDSDMFSLDSYGSALQPAITSDLQAKIDAPVNEQYNQINKDSR